MWEAVLDDAEVRTVCGELRLNVFDLCLCRRDELDVPVSDVVDVLRERLKLGQPFEIRPDEETDLVEQQYELDRFFQLRLAVLAERFEPADHRFRIDIGRLKIRVSIACTRDFLEKSWEDDVSQGAILLYTLPRVRSFVAPVVPWI